MSDLSSKQRYGLSIAALVTGAVLLVMGGRAGDVTTQTAGGTIIAAVVGVLGYRAGKGMIRRDAIAPSVEAVTVKFDELLDLAVEHDDMNAVEYETWRGESALLRAIVADDPSAPVTVPE